MCAKRPPSAKSSSTPMCRACDRRACARLPVGAVTLAEAAQTDFARGVHLGPARDEPRVTRRVRVSHLLRGAPPGKRTAKVR